MFSCFDAAACAATGAMAISPSVVIAEIVLRIALSSVCVATPVAFDGYHCNA